MRVALVSIALSASLVLPGCIAKTAANVVTAPVRAVGKVYDWTTVSQSERDEKRGREMRKREERLGKLERRYEDQLEDCDGGSEEACRKARETYAEMQEILGTIPRAPGDYPSRY